MIKANIGLCLALWSIASAAPARAERLDPSELDVTRLAAALRSRDIHCGDVVDGYLARIRAYDKIGPALNSYIYVATDAEIQAERRADRGLGGALACVTVVLKDNIDTADMPTTAGSPLLAGLPPPTRDAAAVRKLRAAGAIILGKGNLDEWAHAGAPSGGYSAVGGQTLNPYDLGRSPSGSSGGPATAVSANLAMVGLGTDTSGSARGPASATALVSIKPTAGLIDMSGVIPFSRTTDVVAPMTRTVRDAAAVLSVLATDAAHETALKNLSLDDLRFVRTLRADSLKGARIGVVRSFFGGHPNIDALTLRAIALMAKQGAVFVDGLEFDPDLLRTQITWHQKYLSAEMHDALPAYLSTRRGAPSSLADVIERSSGPAARTSPGVLARLSREDREPALSAPTYEADKAAGVKRFRLAIDRLLRDQHLDALVFPTAPCPAGRLDGREDPACGSVPYIHLMASDSGYPQVTVPSGFTSAGLPASLSFLGRADDDGKLLSLAYGYEQASQLRHAPPLAPPLPGARLLTLSPSIKDSPR